MSGSTSTGVDGQPHSPLPVAPVWHVEQPPPTSDALAQIYPATTRTESFHLYCREKNVSAIADYVLHVLVRELPDDPRGAAAAALQQLLNNNVTTDQLRAHMQEHGCEAFCTPTETPPRVAGGGGGAKGSEENSRRSLSETANYQSWASGKHASGGGGKWREPIVDVRSASFADLRRANSVSNASNLGGRGTNSARSTATSSFTPVVRSYLQLHRIGTLIEEWFAELSMERPPDALVFSQRHFAKLYRTNAIFDYVAQKDRRNKQKSVAVDSGEFHAEGDEDELPAVSRGYTPRTSTRGGSAETNTVFDADIQPL